MFLCAPIHKFTKWRLYSNVAYGLESHEINEHKVRDSLEAAQLKI